MEFLQIRLTRTILNIPVCAERTEGLKVGLSIGEGWKVRDEHAVL